MAITKWQCTQCGTINTTQGLRPSVGCFCGKAKDHKHKWVKVVEKDTTWQCTQCGTMHKTQGLRPSVGSFCGRAKDHKHKWVKV